MLPRPSPTVGFRRNLPDLVGLGRIRSDSVGFGRIWSDLVGFWFLVNSGNSIKMRLRGDSAFATYPLLWNTVSNQFSSRLFFLQLNCHYFSFSVKAVIHASNIRETYSIIIRLNNTSVCERHTKVACSNFGMLFAHRCIINIIPTIPPQRRLENYIASSFRLTFSPISSMVLECLGDWLNIFEWGWRPSSNDRFVHGTHPG